MSLDADDIRKLAELARIEIPEDEIPARLADLSGILALIDQLQAADTEGVAPLAHPLETPLRLRDDAVTETDRRDVLLALAPAAEAGLYLVPKVIE